MDIQSLRSWEEWANFYKGATALELELTKVLKTG